MLQCLGRTTLSVSGCMNLSLLTSLSTRLFSSSLPCFYRKYYCAFVMPISLCILCYISNSLGTSKYISLLTDA